MPIPAGRHRRHGPPPSGRSALLTLLATLCILLGSGMAAASLTSPDPSAGPPTGRGALGEAPRGAAVIGTAPAPSPDSIDPRAEPPTSRGDRPEPDGDGAGSDDPAHRDGSGEGIAAMEEQVLALTNAERVAAGCGELRMDERLRAAARDHSQDMAERGYFSHTTPEGASPTDRARTAGWPSGAGENIAMGYGSPAAVMDGWMNSEGHRNNLLRCGYTDIGVGVATDERGRIYWTQNFGTA